MKYIVAIAALFTCCPSFACDINYTAGTQVIPVIQKHGFNFHDYDSVCKKLHDADAKLVIHADVFVDRNGMTLGFADIFVISMDESARADDYRMAYAASSDVPSANVQDKIMDQAIESALSGIDSEIDGYLTTIQIHERELRLEQSILKRSGRKSK